MSLPITKHPLFAVKIPSTGAEIKLRPMLVKEEKILLMAKEASAEKYQSIFLAVRQVVQNCVGEQIDVNKLTLFDVEYLFLQIRASSIDNVVKVVYEDDEDKKEYPFTIDLSNVTVKIPEKPDFNVMISTNTGLKMKWPTAGLYENPLLEKADREGNLDGLFDEFIISCIDSYFEDDRVVPFKNEKREDVVNFIENLDIKTYNKLRDFVNNIPSLYYKIEYKNSLGNDKTVELRSLDSFFIF